MPTTSDPSPDGAIVVLDDVSVRYRVPRERVPTFKEFAIKWLRRTLVFEELCAVSHVSLRIGRGEAVGLVGRNGAGKSTLLKVIARVLRPSEGRVTISGRVAPLLELGAGFDLELTGRENVFLNGALLGRTRREMAARFEAIVDFAELGEFIDAPMRTYSTGMVARLGFAVATDVEADLLLIDETLSVGDFEFQQKCARRIEEFRRGGASILLVSHAPDVVRSLCERVVWIESGRIMAEGAPDAVLDAFVHGVVPGRSASP